jgi:hypothetical protein
MRSFIGRILLWFINPVTECKKTSAAHRATVHEVAKVFGLTEAEEALVASYYQEHRQEARTWQGFLGKRGPGTEKVGRGVDPLPGLNTS